MITNSMFWACVFIITTIIEWVALKIMMDVSSSPKVSKRRYYTILGVIIVLEVIANVLGLFPTIKALFLIGITYIFYKALYKVSWLKNFMVVTLFWIISIGSEGVVITLMTKVYNLESHMSILEPSYIKLLCTVLTKLLLISFVWVYQKFQVAKNHDQPEVLYILLPLVTNVVTLLLIFTYSPMVGIDTQRYYLVILGITLFTTLANVSLIILIRKISKDYVTKLEYKNYQAKMEAEYQYYLQMEAEHEKVRRLYHDINNHIACVKELIQGNDQLSHYIKALEKEIPHIKQTYNTGNKVVDTLLRQKSILCEAKDITLQSRIDLSRCGFIEDKDYCSIFSNALDNAIEACQNMKEEGYNRYINIETDYIKQFLVIKIKNSKNNLITVKDKQYITHKKDKLLHGLGLKNIKSCIEKYNGEMVAQHTHDEFYLKLMVPLKAEGIRKRIPSTKILTKEVV